jgi:hypothetical protein
VALIRRFRLFFLASAALGAIGCGGESELSKQDLIAKGDRLCTQMRDQQPQAPTGSGLPFPALVAYLNKVEEVTQTALAKFRKLKPPRSERKRFDAFLVAAERRLASARQARDAAIARNTAEVTAAINEERSRLGPEYRRIASELGFKVCGSGGGAR